MSWLVSCLAACVLQRFISQAFEWCLTPVLSQPNPKCLDSRPVSCLDSCVLANVSVSEKNVSTPSLSRHNRHKRTFFVGLSYSGMSFSVAQRQQGYWQASIWLHCSLYVMVLASVSRHKRSTIQSPVVDEERTWCHATGSGQCCVFPSFLWQCWISHRKDIWPLKNPRHLSPRFAIEH